MKEAGLVATPELRSPQSGGRRRWVTSILTVWGFWAAPTPLRASAAALEVLADLKQRSTSEHIPPFAFAVVYAGLGETERGLKSLQGGSPRFGQPESTSTPASRTQADARTGVDRIVVPGITLNLPAIPRKVTRNERSLTDQW